PLPVRRGTQVGAVADRVVGAPVARDDGAGDRLARVAVLDDALDDRGRRGGVVEAGAEEPQRLLARTVLLVARHLDLLLAGPRQHAAVGRLDRRPADAQRGDALPPDAAEGEPPVAPRRRRGEQAPHVAADPGPLEPDEVGALDRVGLAALAERLQERP